MNDAKSMKEAIRGIWTALGESRHVIDLNWPLIESGPGVSIVTFPRSGVSDSYLFSEAIVDVYQKMLAFRDYGALLEDGSMLQMTYCFRDRQLVKHRLLFQLAPINMTRILRDFELDAGALLGLLEPKDLLPLIRGSTCLRFDFDIDNAGPGHPASHLTIVDPQCRIPVTHPIAPARFVQFILRHYFPHIEADCKSAWTTNLGRYEECLDALDATWPHFNCGEPAR